jgi:hypothetical protein
MYFIMVAMKLRYTLGGDKKPIFDQMDIHWN